MVDLTKPRDGLYYEFGKFLIHFNFAKSWTWGRKDNDGEIVRTHLFLIEKIQKDNMTLLQFIILPLKVNLGYINN